MSVWGQSIKASHERNKMYIAALTEEAKIVQSAREYGLRDTHFAWTRRIIALSAIFSIIVLPKVAPLIYPGYPLDCNSWLSGNARGIPYMAIRA
jgi:hypothetical protein